MDGFPSGQRGQTVNLLQIASVVRIHLHPFALMSSMEQCLARKSMQSSITQCVRWCGGIGRRKGLKIPRSNIRTGSSPVFGTSKRRRIFASSFAVPKNRGRENPTYIRGPRGILCTRGEKEQTSKRQTNKMRLFGQKCSL